MKKWIETDSYKLILYYEKYLTLHWSYAETLSDEKQMCYRNQSICVRVFRGSVNLLKPSGFFTYHKV